MNERFLAGTEAVLFDMEGTLVDFQWDLAGAVRDVLAMLYGFGFPRERLQGKKYSILMTEAIRIAPEIGRSPDQVREQIGAIYDRYDEDAFSRWALRSGARELLDLLNCKGIKTGLVSNVGRRAVEKGFSRLHLTGLLQAIVTRNDVRALKPSGEGIILALNQLQVRSGHALHVGDSLDDIHAAREAGIRVMIISGGEYPEGDLLAAGPDFLITGFGDLIASLRKGTP